MTEALVSTLLETLKAIIVDGVVEEARLLRGVKGEFKKLKANLEAIQALLEDAEEKQITDRAIKLWLDRLKEAALDMEDALDEWRTRVLIQRQRDAAHHASFLLKVRSFLRCFSFDHGIVRQHHIASNIKELNGKLDEIVKEKDRYELTANSQMRRQSRRRESTSLVDESKVVGRDEIKKSIISHLLCEASRVEEETCNPVQTISIVGMGGSGKTTLAQVIYNDVAVKQNFTRRIWVCVSDDFDEVKVAKAILAGLEGLGKDGVLKLKSVTLDALLQRICESIQGKKFLLVLDDVWTEMERDFEALKLTFKHGAPGSRVLMTTRNENVARVLQSQLIIHLGLLSDELCWSILKKKAMEGKTCKDMEEVGKRIAAKCKGLPLVAQTLGGLLQFKTTKRDWEMILSSEMWGLDIVQKDVFIPLLLSYYDLPPPIRRCFTFCAIFPKGIEIPTNHMIAYWMAQSYLGSEDDSYQWEMKGQEYCKILLARSFFQDFFLVDGFPCVKMHDLVHDFALLMCKDEFMTEEIVTGTDKVDVKIYQPEKARHLTFVIENGAYFPSYISGAEKLRSISTFGGSRNVLFSGQAFLNLFMQAQRLRLLCLQFLQFEDSTAIPKEIGKLLHLRYLEVSLCDELMELPREICKLYNLQYLDFYYTGIERLPEEIGNLINLRVLSTLECFNLTSYPKSVGKLTRLTQLIGVIVRTDCDHPQEFSLGDLANLEQLMVLGMALVGKEINPNEARKVNLQNLEELQICVGEEFVGEDDSILESLNMSRVPTRAVVDSISPDERYERGFCSYL